MSTFQLHTTVPASGTLTIPLPESYSGTEVHVTIRSEERQTEQTKEKKTTGELVESLSGIPEEHTEENLYEAKERYTMEDFVQFSRGLLKGCGIESPQQMREERVNDLIDKYK